MKTATRRIWTIVTLFLLSLVAASLGATPAAADPASQAGSQRVLPGQVPAGLTAAEWGFVLRAIAPEAA